MTHLKGFVEALLMTTHIFHREIRKFYLDIPLSRNDKWASTWQNQTKWMCAQRRLRSEWASAQSDQSLLCIQWLAKDPSFLQADSQDWSDWADTQADLSLRWVHMQFCWFCRTLAQIILSLLYPKLLAIYSSCKEDGHNIREGRIQVTVN